jgi:CopG family transcriptional regulator/antitoxin EndoAI
MGGLMAKVVVTMPDDLLREVDSAAKETRTNRSQFLRQALTRYLAEQKKRKFEALMAEGYLEMADEDIADATGYLGALNNLENQDNG